LSDVVPDATDNKVISEQIDSNAEFLLPSMTKIGPLSAMAFVFFNVFYRTALSQNSNDRALVFTTYAMTR
jgi:hypothetical protein